MKKKLFMVLLAAMLVFTACSQGEGESSTIPEPSSVPESDTQDSSEGPDIAPVEEYYPQLEEPKAGQDIATLKTSMGDITVMLFPEYAPKAVENFLTHAENGYYDGLTFHRVMEEFMIQGGDPEGSGRGGKSIWDTAFEDEFAAEMHHFKGALAMANAGPNTNGSQFFIVSNDTLDPALPEQMKAASWPEELVKHYETIGGTPWLDFQHTVFGMVIEGMDVLDAIEKVETDADSKPLTPVTIETIEVSKFGE